MAGVYPQRTREASRWDRHPNRSWQVDETWPRLLDGHIRLQLVLEPCGYSGHSLREPDWPPECSHVLETIITSSKDSVAEARILAYDFRTAGLAKVETEELNRPPCYENLSGPCQSNSLRTCRQNLSIEPVACNSARQLEGVANHHPIVLRTAWLSRRFTAHLTSPPLRAWRIAAGTFAPHLCNRMPLAIREPVRWFPSCSAKHRGSR